MDYNSSEVSGYKDVLTGSDEKPTAPGAVRVQSASAPELRTLAGVAVGALVVAALYFGQDVLIPITLAVMLSFVLSPVVTLLQRLRLWRTPAVIIAVLATLGLLGGIGTLIGSQAAALTDKAPEYARTIEDKVQNVQSFAVARLASITQGLSGHRSRKDTRAPALTARAAEGASPRAVPVRVVEEQTSPFTLARTVLQPILGPLETTVIVVIVAIFVLIQKEDLRDRFIRLFGSNDLHRTTRAMDDAGKRLSRYFLSQLAVNTCFGVVIGIGLWFIGVPTPAMWGVMAALLRFVPYIGSLLAALAPAALAAAVDPGWTMAIEVIALFFVIEPLVGYVIEPLLYGHSTGLSPVSVIVSAIFWTWLWGPIGLIMSTPLTLVLVVLGRHVKSLEFFDVLLGDRPALTPVESFYQRVLASNPDEALAQAETMLTDHTLIDYYDEVVLAALKLAVEDRARGTVDHERQQGMTRTMQSVITELGDHAAPRTGETIPSARSNSGRQVACIAGSGPYDEVVTAMLAQVLRAQGLAPRTIPGSATTRETIGMLDLDGVSVIAISYLELHGTPAHLRYLIKRLRARAPGARIVVGLWPQGEAALNDIAIQEAIGSDRYVATLVDAVGAITEPPAAEEKAA